MTATDRKVARILLARYPVAGLGTLAELSELAGISAPSIIRCVKKLGFAGYPEYQKALHAEIGELLGRHQQSSRSDHVAHLPHRLRGQHDEYVFAINRTFSLMQESEIGRAAELLSRKDRQVIVLGGFMSSALARLAYRRLFSLRPNCELLSSDPLARSERLIDLDKECVLLAIDLPPKDDELESFVRLATERGTEVVVITDENSPTIWEQASYALIAGTASEPHAAYVAAVCLIDVMLGEIKRHIGQPAHDRLRQLQAVRT